MQHRRCKITTYTDLISFCHKSKQIKGNVLALKRHTALSLGKDIGSHCKQEAGWALCGYFSEVFPVHAMTAYKERKMYNSTHS